MSLDLFKDQWGYCFVFHTKIMLRYTQQKYNLLSEESEGYAKLLTLLCELNKDNVESTIRDMQSLIGNLKKCFVFTSASELLLQATLNWIPTECLIWFWTVLSYAQVSTAI